MKIALISDTCYPQINGMSNTLRKMTEYMEKNNIEYRFYVPEWEDSLLDEPKNIERYEAMKPWFYPECRIALPNPNNNACLKRSLMSFDPDILHIATEFTMGYMGLKAFQSLDAALVMSYHTDIPGYLRHYNFQFLESAVRKYFHWFHSFAELNLVPSHHTMEQLREQGFNNLAYWKRGIDTAAFSPNNRNTTLKKVLGAETIPLLLYVGRIAVEKELDVLVDAANLLNTRGVAFRLAIVGDGPYREALEAKKIPNIIFPGYKKDRELQQYYASADIFVFPSSTETYGNVILEAMASGLPVIAPYAGGVKENLVDKSNGLVFLTGNPQDMADKMEQLILSEGFRKQLADNARHDVEKKSWEAVFDKLFASYESVIRQKSLLRKRTA